MKKWCVCVTVFLLAALALAAHSREILAQTAADSGFAVIFYSGRAGNDDIFILQPGHREPVNLSRHPAKDHCPAASPDGKRIVFLSSRSGNFARITRTPEHEIFPAWSSCVRLPGSRRQAAAAFKSADIDRYLEGASSDVGGGCALLLLRRGKVIYQGAFGQVDLGRRIPIASATT